MFRYPTYVLLLICFFFDSKAQCSLSGLSPSYCLNAPSSNLTYGPAGGVLSGPGLLGSVFNPALAGVGVHTLSYVNCSSTYSLESDVFAVHAYTPNYIWFGDNAVSPALPIGFRFRFFCNSYDSIYLSSNGFFTFTPPVSSGCCQGLSLPNTNAPANLIAFAWTDLDPSQGGTVRYCTVGTAPNRILVVSFNCIFHKTGNGPVTSEVYLYESSNLIEISTVTKPIPTGTVQYNTTMGIQGPAGQAYVVPGRNGTSNWTATNELYRFIPGPYCDVQQTTTVSAPPTLTASVSKTVICKGEPVHLSGFGATSYSWSSGQSGSSVIDYPMVSTVYTLSGWDQQNCSSTASTYVNVGSCEALPEIQPSLLSEFTVYPNPSSGHVYLRASSPVVVEVLDARVSVLKKIFLSPENNYERCVSDLDPGLYFVRESNRGVTKKLIVSPH